MRNDANKIIYEGSIFKAAQASGSYIVFTLLHEEDWCGSAYTKCYCSLSMGARIKIFNFKEKEVIRVYGSLGTLGYGKVGIKVTSIRRVKSESKRDKE